MKEKPIIFSTHMIQALLNTKPGTWPPEPIDASKPLLNSGGLRNEL
jgi:hypothetical protein